ncbi:MAG: N-acetylglucosamine-6-phosphate deacetylase [Acidobacteriota bacterium]
MTDRMAIVGAAVVTPFGVVEKGLVLCEEGRIAYAGPAAGIDPEPDSVIIDATGQILMPGFIDTHFHGSGGEDVMAGGVAGLGRIAQSVLRFGTTGFLATTIAARHEELLRSVEETVAARKSAGSGAAILGIHLEGPFMNVAFKGAQPEWGIRDPNLDECEELLLAGGGLVKIMTLAPELPGGLELIRLLVRAGVAPSLGHSTADYDTALAAIEAGATRATHLYNAMSGVHHRKPGLAAACLCEPGIQAEIICDGVHVNPHLIDLAWKAKGPTGLTLVTDATAAQGHGDGIYTLGDFEIEVRGPLCTLRDGVTIAGSVLTMNKAVGNAISFTGMSLVDAAEMAASGPARVCGVADRKGSIEVGKDADFALLNPDFSVAQTIIGGLVAFGAAH